MPPPPPPPKPTTTTSKSAPANLAAQTDVAATLESFTNKQLSSPHELTDFVDILLDTLQGKFDEMKMTVEQKSECGTWCFEGWRGVSDCSLSRFPDLVAEMTRRIDVLESSIEELIQHSAARE